MIKETRGYDSHAYQAGRWFLWWRPARTIDGFVDDALNFIRIGVGIARPNVLNGALEHAPPDGILDEFREVALLQVSQLRLQGEHLAGAISVDAVKYAFLEH